MPIYEYQCVDCGGRDQRVAGLDDHTALCFPCGGLMLRLDEDVFQPYFEGRAEPAQPETKVKAS
jgi:putative FmdB family regulatory protein